MSLARRLDRQKDVVARLARQLEFERLMLQRLRQRMSPDLAEPPTSRSRPTMSMAEVYAAALLRRIDQETPADAGGNRPITP